MIANERELSVSVEFYGHYVDNSAHYDADNLYGSAHVGMGYVFDLSRNLSLDVHGCYSFTYLEGDLGIVDMSITIRSTPTDPMALDLGVKAYAGDVQGIMGSATLSYAF